mgnify:CR=1 FL=1
MFAHRLDFEGDAISVVDEPIEDGIGDGAITEVGMPLIDRQLTGDQRRAAIVAIIEDLQQIDEYLLMLLISILFLCIRFLKGIQLRLNFSYSYCKVRKGIEP